MTHQNVRRILRFFMGVGLGMFIVGSIGTLAGSPLVWAVLLGPLIIIGTCLVAVCVFKGWMDKGTM